MLFFQVEMSLINMLFNIIIVALSLLYYKKSKNVIAIFIAIKFSFSFISHFILISDWRENLFISIIIVRLIAYLLIIFSMYYEIRQKVLPFIKKSKLSKIFKITITSIAITISIIILIFSRPIYHILIYKISYHTQLYFLNLISCFIIFAFGLLTYKITTKIFYLILGISFGFSGISYAATLLGFAQNFPLEITFIKTIGYLILIVYFVVLIKEKTFYYIVRFISNIKFQIFIIIISIFIIVLLFYFPHFKFNSKDPAPHLMPIKPKLSEEPITEVKTGLFIKNFPLFDMIDNDFIVSAFLWFEFDPHHISLDILENFSFEKGIILKKSKPETKIIGDKLFAQYKVRIQFKSDLDFKLFPFEDHQIFIILTNTYLDPKEVIMTSVATNFLLGEKVFTGDWIKINEEVNYGYIESALDEHDPEKTTIHPAVIFSLDFQKAGMKNILIIFAPLLIAFFLSLFSLMINITNKGGILSLSVGSVSTLIFNLFVIQRITPHTSYFTVSDSIYSLLLISVFFILLLNIYLIKQVKEQYQEIPINLSVTRNLTFLFFIFFILLSIYWLLY